MDKNDFDVITREIQFHETNCDNNTLNKDYKRGFINGLYHLRNVFASICQHEKMLFEGSNICNVCATMVLSVDNTDH